MAAGRIIHSAGPRVGDQWYTLSSEWSGVSQVFSDASDALTSRVNESTVFVKYSHKTFPNAWFQASAAKQMTIALTDFSGQHTGPIYRGHVSQDPRSAGGNKTLFMLLILQAETEMCPATNNRVTCSPNCRPADVYTLVIKAYRERRTKAPHSQVSNYWKHSSRLRQWNLSQRSIQICKFQVYKASVVQMMAYIGESGYTV